MTKRKGAIIGFDSSLYGNSIVSVRQNIGTICTTKGLEDKFALDTQKDPPDYFTEIHIQVIEKKGLAIALRGDNGYFIAFKKITALNWIEFCDEGKSKVLGDSHVIKSSLNYSDLKSDPSKVVVGPNAFKKAVRILYDYEGGDTRHLHESILNIAFTICEASRFECIKSYIELLMRYEKEHQITQANVNVMHKFSFYSKIVLSNAGLFIGEFKVKINPAELARAQRDLKLILIPKADKNGKVQKN